MLQKINYQKELDKLITDLQKEEKVPTLLLHSCCAPCSSYVLELLQYHVIFLHPKHLPGERIQQAHRRTADTDQGDAYEISGAVHCGQL